MSFLPASYSSRPVVVPLGLSRSRGTVQIRGALRVDWAARLSAELTRRGVAIRTLDAHRGNAGWLAEIDMTSDTTDLVTLDFAALVDVPVDVPKAVHLELTHVRVEPRTEHGGSLLLTVEGRDRMGFLATLLHTLAFQSLFPVEIRARTFDTTAVDSVWVQGLGHRPPPADAQGRLLRAMDAIRAT